MLRWAGRLKFAPCEILLSLSYCWVSWRSSMCLMSGRAGTGSGILRLELKKCVVRTASALVRSLPGGIHLARRFLLIQRNLPVAASAGTAGAFTILNREADGAAQHATRRVAFSVACINPHARRIQISKECPPFCFPFLLSIGSAEFPASIAAILGSPGMMLSSSIFITTVGLTGHFI